jgi:nicotinate-nucleotide adenylyltransferase
MDRDSLIQRIDSLVRSLVSPARYAHCRATALLAAELCRRFSVDSGKGRIAGLAHDMARELPSEELLRLASGDGLPVSTAEEAAPILLHGRAAAVLLKKRAGYADPEVLDAICDHVTGRPSMGGVSRILFVSDFLEPSRDFLPPAFRDRTLSLGLDAMVLAVLERKIQYVRAQSLEVTEASHALLEELSKDAG